MAVTETISCAADATSPPTTPAPTVAASAHSTSASPVNVATGVLAGQATPTSRAVGTAPIAAMPARFAAVTASAGSPRP